MLMSVKVLPLVTIILVELSPSLAHPQCLDFYPPYKSQNDLEFCKEYSKYGCCGAKRDARLKEEYFMARERLNESTYLRCGDFLRGIVCAECHPYAAHVFDAEDPFVVEKFGIRKRHQVFPGLCKGYCKAVFDDCREVIKARGRSTKFLDFVSSSTKEVFCSWAEPSDADYCYPKILKAPSKERPLPNTKDILTLCVKDYQSSLNNPLFAVHANDGTHRLFVVEQRGIVYVVLADGRRLDTPFLNITSIILNSGSGWDERGLLGLAFHPNYKHNGRFFIYYSHVDISKANQDQEVNKEYWWLWKQGHHIRISEFIVSDNPYVGDASSERVILEIQQPEANHEGGMLLFGDDGYLYVFVGDGGGAGDSHGKYGNSLNMSTLLGKVLRINVDVYDGRAYTIPQDNPFLHNPSARPEIYAYGIRNIWRCSKDRGNENNDNDKGRIFCGDVGQNAHEEIDIIHKGGNYGWRAKEGFSCYDKQLCNSQFLKNEVLPILSYNHSIGKSIVGGYLYRGCKYPNMRGYYFYADTVTGRIFAAKENPENGKWEVKEVLLGNSTYCNNGVHNNMAKTILSFGEDEAGELYILSTSFPDPQIPLGKIYTLVDPFRREDPEKCWSPKVPPKRLRNLIPRKISRDGVIKPDNSSECIDKLKMCQFFKNHPGNCNIVKKFTRSTLLLTAWISMFFGIG